MLQGFDSLPLAGRGPAKALPRHPLLKGFDGIFHSLTSKVLLSLDIHAAIGINRETSLEKPSLNLDDVL